MWQTEHSTQTTATPEAVWTVWSDVERWPEWNGDLERAEISGPFDAGSTITMHPRVGDAIELRLADVSKPVRFTDEADLGQVIVRTVHEIRPDDGDGSRIVYRMEIRGPAADTIGAQVGPEITADFPDVLAALAERAERAER